MMTPQELTMKIMEHAHENGLSLLESAVEIAEKLDIDVEDIAPHITGTIKDQMQAQCEQAGYLQKRSNSSHTFE